MTINNVAVAIIQSEGDTTVHIRKDEDSARIAAEGALVGRRALFLNTPIVKLEGITLRAARVLALLALVFVTPSEALAWGDEDWGSSETVIVMDAEPDYLQRRIEARQQRLTAERAERARTLAVIRENDRRIERDNATKALGAAGVAIADYINGVEYNGVNNETQVEW